MSLHRSPLLADSTNVSILRALSGKPRMGMSELARMVGMSAPAVRERVQRLEEAGLVRGCRLELDPALLGYPVALMIRIRPMPGQLRNIIDLAQRTPRIVECHRITGEDCFIMRAHVESLGEIDALLDSFLIFGQTTTSIIQSSPIPGRPLPLGD
jgi:Lrp/AsnC family transcriptional regulator, leucine-responsive regulatory protein